MSFDDDHDDNYHAGDLNYNNNKLCNIKYYYYIYIYYTDICNLDHIVRYQS
jgi:hypothetical protein